jgi:Putative transposase
MPLDHAIGFPSSESGAITFVQRFGSSLNLNVHLHFVVVDGVFVETLSTPAQSCGWEKY